jgi:hypothetical protein
MDAIVDLETGESTPVTPEDIAFGFFAVSPDDSFVATPRSGGGLDFRPLRGGESRHLDVDEQPIRWSADSRFLYTVPLGAAPATLRLVDVRSGEAAVVATLLLRDPAGVVQVSPVTVTPDGSSYVYGYVRRLSVVWIVEGLRKVPDVADAPSVRRSVEPAAGVLNSPPKPARDAPGRG